MAEQSDFKKLPSVNALLDSPGLSDEAERFRRDVLRGAVRRAISAARERIAASGKAPDDAWLVRKTRQYLDMLAAPALRPVINATGVVLHTNLGRAPLGAECVRDIADTCTGYTNLEFDLEQARRGSRMTHVREVLRILTAAEDVLVVNNNAASVLLALHALAKGAEVVISRGEMIEIGGSFRIPEILAAGGAHLVEVGTTNRTRLADYEAAITPDTRVLLTVHRSNFAIRGFTESPTIEELAELAHRHGLCLLYDLGSGLLEPSAEPANGEPDVRSAIEQGADVVAFSCDKLLGGPQAGVLAGRGEYISRMARSPLMRALRVGKLTIAALSAVCRRLLEHDGLTRTPVLAMLNADPEATRLRAQALVDRVEADGIRATVVESRAQCGGGSLPDVFFASFAVEVSGAEATPEAPGKTFAERMHEGLLRQDPPVLAVLREGRLFLDMLTVPESELPTLVKCLKTAAQNCGGDESPPGASSRSPS